MGKDSKSVGDVVGGALSDQKNKAQGKMTLSLFFHPATLIATTLGVGLISRLFKNRAVWLATVGLGAIMLYYFYDAGELLFSDAVALMIVLCVLPMSGTLGTIAGVIMLATLGLQPRVWGFSPEGLFPLLILSTIILYIVGTWATKVYMLKTGAHDPKEVVIDEVVGIFVTVLLIAALYVPLVFWDPNIFVVLLSLTVPWYVLSSFVLFRFFDIVKMGKARHYDKVKGPHGVMLDDVWAGIYAAIAFYVLFALCFVSGILDMLVRHADPSLIKQYWGG